MEPTVKQFRGEYNFLSNFYPCRVRLEFSMGTLTFPSSEHAFMFLKAPGNSAWRDTCTDPKVSATDIKRLGRKVKIEREDWDTYRIEAMEMVLRAKFLCNPFLADKLKGIKGDIQEGNTWGDVFWGVDLTSKSGANHLGKLLMKLRDEFKHFEPKVEESKPPTLP